MNARRIGKLLTILMVMAFAMPGHLTRAQELGTPGAEVPTADVLIALYPKGLADGSRFEAEMKSGETKTLTAFLANFGLAPIKLRTYTSSIVPVPNGGLQISPQEEEAQGSATWITYTEDEFTLEPQQSIDRDITITVPEGTEPGQYVSAVVLETVDPIKDGSGAFEQYYRKVVAIYVTVPGDVVVDFSFGKPEILVAGSMAGVQFPVTNNSNVRIDLRGELTLTAEDGTVVHTGEVTLGPIYMGQETVIQVPLTVLPPAGDYTLTYAFTDKDSEVTKTSEALAVVVPESESAEAAPISFENVAIEPNADPIVFANVSVDVTIAQANYPSTRLTLSVYHNGEHLEDFVLADNLSLSQGTTNVAQRYLPATNWESGTYTFSLKLESTEGGQTSLLFEEKDMDTLEVPE